MADAPSTATYILQLTDTTDLPNSQSLESLGSDGILKTVGNSLGIASGTSDYMPYNQNLASIASLTIGANDMIFGASAHTFTVLENPMAAKTLNTDSDGNLYWGEMAYADAPFIIAGTSSETDNMGNLRVLTGGQGITFTDEGPGSLFSASVTGNLNSIVQLDTTGILCLLPDAGSVTRSITGNSTITVTNGDGSSGNIALAVNSGTSIQNSIYALAGSQISTQPELNFIAGEGVSITLVDNGDNNRADVTINIADLPTSTVNFVTLTDYTSELPDSFPLSALSTGLMKVTTTTGVITTAIAGTDYLAPSANLTSISSASHVTGELLVANGSGYVGLGIGSTGQVLTVAGGTATWAALPAEPPLTATYILNTPNGSLTNSFALSTLSTGLTKVTNGTGAITTAIAGTDYLVPSANLTSISGTTNGLGSILLGTGSGYGALTIGLSSGAVLTTNGTTASWTALPAIGNPDATYIVKTADASLPDAFALSTLSTGIVKVTTSTGALTTAVAGTDYLAPSANLTSISSAANTTGELLVGSGSGYAGLSIGSSGQVLTVSGGTGAWETPANPAAHYIVNTTDSSLSNAFALSTLGTGSLRVTTSTGALSSYTPTIFVTCVADGTLPSYTYSSGVITFTANGAIGPQYTDNVTTVATNIVFNYDYNGSNAPYLGAYVITTKGTGGSQEVWTRVPTFNSATNMIPGIEFIPASGTVYSNSSFVFTTQGAIVVGSTPLTFNTDAFTRTWSGSFSNVNSNSSGGNVLFNLPANKIFMPTAMYVSGYTPTYTANPSYFNGTSTVDLGSAIVITAATAGNTLLFTLDKMSGVTGVATPKSSSGATQAGIGVDITSPALSSDTPLYTVVGQWIKN